MLGLATKLLDAAKAGVMRRGREVQQLDLGHPGSSLAAEAPQRSGGVLAGDRAPDAPITGAAGQRTRLFELTRGPHWTAIGYQTTRDAAPATRESLHVHRIGDDGDLQDPDGHLAAAYGLAPGDWLLIRPDGYVGAIVGAYEVETLDVYLGRVGLPERSSRRELRTSSRSARPSAAL